MWLSVAEHVRQLARRLRRTAGERAHLVDLRLQLTQALFGFGPFCNEGGEGALAFAEVFRRVVRRKVAPGVEIETEQDGFRQAVFSVILSLR